eukprot:TRINITY_DN49377_c0_g1_i1.p1 TRINITY_DN49377_c0_g1~~TRINITY_DN49377_c0_g1_i1.p1  ORF type:complete len:609 (-),score=73.63 TRINITY_DN49377_c0_g1_i1:181-2007(-)
MLGGNDGHHSVTCEYSKSGDGYCSSHFRRPSALQGLFDELVQLQTKFLKVHEKELADLWLLVEGGEAFEFENSTGEDLRDCARPFLCSTIPPTAESEAQDPPRSDDHQASERARDDKTETSSLDLGGLPTHCRLTQVEDVRALAVVDAPVDPFLQDTGLTSRTPADAEEEYYREIESKAYDAANKRLRHTLSDRGSVLVKQLLSQKPKSSFRLQTIVQHVSFDLFFGALILLNTAVMAAEIDHASRNGVEAEGLLPVMGETLTIIFVVELLLRMASSGLKRFFYPMDFWNYFDLFLVTTSLVDLTVSAVMAQSPQSANFISVRVLRLLRITRAIKVFRAVRIVRFVKALRTLLNSLIGTMKQVLWAFILMFALCFLFALVIAQAVSTFRMNNFPDLPKGERLPGLLGEYWGSVPRCMYTLFMSLTNGIEWEEVAEALVEVGFQWAAVFIIYVALIQYVVINVVIGVFCESAAEAARQDVDLAVQYHREQKNTYCKKIRTIFQRIDSDSSNSITYPEMRDYLSSDTAQAMFAALDLDIENIWELFRLLDARENATIDIDEFVSGCLRLKGNASALDLAKVSYDNKMFRKRMFEFMKSVETQLNIATVKN